MIVLAALVSIACSVLEAQRIWSDGLLSFPNDARLRELVDAAH